MIRWIGWRFEAPDVDRKINVAFEWHRLRVGHNRMTVCGIDGPPEGKQAYRFAGEKAPGPACERCR